jgi:hypothetical protein
MVHMWLLCYICVAHQMRIVIHFSKIFLTCRIRLLNLHFGFLPRSYPCQLVIFYGWRKGSMFTRKHCCKWLKSAVRACVKIVIFWFLLRLEIMFSKQKYRDIFLKKSCYILLYTWTSVHDNLKLSDWYTSLLWVRGSSYFCSVYHGECVFIHHIERSCWNGVLEIANMCHTKQTHCSLHIKILPG